MPSCYASGCDHVSGGENCSFFTFPADKKLYEEWITLCPFRDRAPTNEEHLCSCHFIDGNKLNLPTVFAQHTNNLDCEPPESKTDELINTMDSEDLQKSNMIEKDDEFECRACLDTVNSKVNSVNLFQPWTQPWEGMGSTIAEDLSKIGNIQLSSSDRHSKVICDSCYKKLQNACSFAAIVYKSDKVLRQRYPDEEEPSACDMVWPKPIQLAKNVNGSVYETAMDIEIKQEVLSDNDYGTSDGPYKELADSVEIKIEPEEMMRPPPIQINGTFSYQDPDMAINTTMQNGHDMLEEYLETPLKEEPTSEVDSDAVSNDLPLDCMLCAKTFHSVSGLKAHVIAQHSYRTVKRKVGEKPSPQKKKDKYVCATCRRGFVTSTDLMVHETCHNKATCYSCNQKFDTFELLTKHRVRCKAIIAKEVPKPKTLEDVKRTIAEGQSNTGDDILPKDELQCHLCPEKFSDSYYMTIHQEIHHSSAEQAPAPTQPLDAATTMETETLESIFSEDK